MKKLKTLMLCMAVIMPAVPAFAYSDYATTLVSYSESLSGTFLYNSPSAVLGAPTTNFANTWGSAAKGRVKIVEPAYNTDLAGNKVITTLKTGDYIEVAFDHAVGNDAANPYGIDFLVFGNSFYAGSGSVSDATDMNTYTLNGSIFSEGVLVSVSQDGENWYAFSDGQSGDSAYPTQAYLWDAPNARWSDTLSDFTKPVDPSVTVSSGDTAADIIAAYDGSGGGTGFDLDDLYDLHGVSLDWIQYVRVEGVDGFSGGEIDAFSDVAPVPVPAAVWLLGSGLAGLIGLRRRQRK